MTGPGPLERTVHLQTITEEAAHPPKVPNGLLPAEILRTPATDRFTLMQTCVCRHPSDIPGLDPSFATGLAYAAWAHELQETFGLGATPAERARALQLAESALIARSDDPLAGAIAGLVLMAFGGQWQRCLVMMDEAMTANPNNATVLSLTAFCNMMFGDLDFCLSPPADPRQPQIWNLR